jgi:Domain of unknown function (DUF4124)
MDLSLARIAILVGLVALASAARADIYRCVDADGNTLYSDTPCARSAKSTANITESVGACTTAECEEQRRQQSDEARQRLRAEKEELNDAAARRRQADAAYERERADLLYRKALEDRLAAMADQAVQGSNNLYYDYPGFPVYPIAPRPCVRCRPTPLPVPGIDKKRAKEPSVRLKLDH